MRLEPFSPRDTSRAVQAVVRNGKWAATRAGRRVRLERIRPNMHEPAGVAWFMSLDRHRICGIAATVKDALDELAIRIKTAPAVERRRKPAAEECAR